MTDTGIIPSPNIWCWTQLYEAENRAQDVGGRIRTALQRIAPWEGKTVVDVGCGTGFHLGEFASVASRVVGVEPYEPLLREARERTIDLERVEVRLGRAESLPVSNESVDIVHARTAYFFGAGCGPGISEAMRVLRPGGTLVVVDLDASAAPYGDWMRADLPKYNCQAVEAFFSAQGFELERVMTRWKFQDIPTLRAVLGIEFTKRTAASAARGIAGLEFDVQYRIHSRRKPVGLELS